MTPKQALVLVAAFFAIGIWQIACELDMPKKPPADPVVNIIPLTIDGCMYILLESGYKTNTNYAFGFTHSGRCTNHQQKGVELLSTNKLPPVEQAAPGTNPPAVKK